MLYVLKYISKAFPTHLTSIKVTSNRVLLGFWVSISRVGISGTTAKSRKRKFVPSSHPGPFAVVASSRKSQSKVGNIACFDFLYQNKLTM